MHSTRKYARTAGISLLLMAAAAGYAYGVAYAGLVNPTQASETWQQIQSARSQFVAGIIGWWVIFLLDLLVAWSLYQYFRAEQPRLSLSAAILRGVYTVILGAAIVQQMKVLPLLADSSQADQVLALMLGFDSVWSHGLILFGVHLLGLGLLAWRATRFPRVLAVLLLVAGLGYMAIHGARWWVPEQAEAIQQAETWLGVPMALGELALAVWLLVRGGKASRSS
ncbi:MAG: DUF4386 domain-containing protein [Bacteroidota bacterium]